MHHYVIRQWYRALSFQGRREQWTSLHITWFDIPSVTILPLYHASKDSNKRDLRRLSSSAPSVSLLCVAKTSMTVCQMHLWPTLRCDGHFCSISWLIAAPCSTNVQIT